jgi:hypothetical protein
MTMTLTEAMGWATTALESRARQWRDAADGNFNQDELFEADTDERLNMADMYEEALAVLSNKALKTLMGELSQATSEQHP